VTFVLARNTSRIRTLTPERQERQRMALRVYVETGSQKEAAAAMGVSHDTIRNLLSELYASLGVDSHLDALRMLGWVTTPTED
jgi:DNA-directed RNA polymerase specialized sigma24 family protein